MPLIAGIPERYEQGFKNISGFSDSEFSSIKNSLLDGAYNSSLQGLAHKISQITNLDYEDIFQAFISIGSLNPVLENTEIVEEVVNDITALAKSEGITKDSGIFRERIDFLIKNDQIFLAAKAYDLARESANIYIDARIVTDLRPIFGINVEEEPHGSIILHTLHLHYQDHKESDHKDLFITLDINDIKTLKDLLIRAEKKESSLQQFLKKSALSDLKD